MERFILVFGVFVSIFTGPVIIHAQNMAEEEIEEVVVTATRLETPLHEVGSSITVITAEELESKQVRTVHEALESVPGVEVVREGGMGQHVSVFLRGAKPEHVLVLIDGIEANDPISPSRAFNFAHLTVDNIERIEVLRGPQGTLYGSDAMAGVINITTRKGRGSPTVTLLAEGGSFSTYMEGMSVSGGTDRVGYSLSLSHVESDGISAADEADGNTEQDGYENISFSGRLDLTLVESFDLGLVVRAWTSETEIDEFIGVSPYPFQDDPNSTLKEDVLFFRVEGDLHPANGVLDQTLGLSLTHYDRDYRNSPDAVNPNDDWETNDGRILKLDWQGNYFFSEVNTLTFGAELEEDKGESESNFNDVQDRDVDTTAFFVQDQLQLSDALTTTLGGRVDDHSEFDSEFTYRLTAAYLLEDAGVTVRGTFGTGFKAPSVFQLFNSSFGNPDLDPERSRGWDLGVERRFPGNRGNVGLNYFRMDFEDLIQFGFPYTNVGEAKTEGIELFSSARLARNLELKGSYTFTDTEEGFTGEDLIRRPEDKFSLDATWRFNDSGHFTLSGMYVGEREDEDFSDIFNPVRVTLDSYILVNLSASVQMSEVFRISGRVENLLDEEYQEVLGYGTPGLSAYVGIRAAL